MASPAEIGHNLPDILPEDFGGWDNSDSPSNTSADGSKMLTRDSHEAASNVTPFPEPESVPVVMRGFATPLMRAPRISSAPSSTRVSATPAQEDPVFVRRALAAEPGADKQPETELNAGEVATATFAIIDRKPDTPLFSSIAMANADDDSGAGPRLLNDLIEREQERKARRKWILSGSVFGVALVLVAFQLLHAGNAGKIKQIVATTKAATISTESETGPDSLSASPAAQPIPSAPKPAPGNRAQGDVTTHAEAVPAPEQTEMMQTQLMAPTRLPQDAKTVKQNDTPPPAPIAGASMVALNGSGPIGNVFAGHSNSAVVAPKVVSVSAGVAVGMLLRRTQPAYPSIARSARVQGTVVLQATITRYGSVTNLKVLSGPPMLRQAAIDAVKTWQYKPYLLNNEPTEVDTQVNVVFSLGS
jgi:TonB family C-terminal domain